jgi:hypothetical protein
MSETPQTLITPYKMMMKRQFQVLQYLFGLRSSYPPETPVVCAELSNSSIKDVVFVCVDTEFIPDGRKLCNQEFQLGVAILDTRALLGLTTSAPSSPPPQTQQEAAATTANNSKLCTAADILQTRNWCVGSPEYCLIASRKYAFGDSVSVQLEDLKPCFESMIPAYRDVVLVTHDGGGSDLKFIRELGIKIQPIFTLDTQMVAQSPLQLTYKVSLKELMVTLECPSGRCCMHVAGNDANFTLRALLMLSIRDLDMAKCSEEQLTAVETIKAVAQFPRPENAIEKKEKAIHRHRLKMAE